MNQLHEIILVLFRPDYQPLWILFKLIMKTVFSDYIKTYFTYFNLAIHIFFNFI